MPAPLLNEVAIDRTDTEVHIVQCRQSMLEGEGVPFEPHPLLSTSRRALHRVRRLRGSICVLKSPAAQSDPRTKAQDCRMLN